MSKMIYVDSENVSRESFLNVHSDVNEASRMVSAKKIHLLSVFFVPRSIHVPTASWVS